MKKLIALVLIISCFSLISCGSTRNSETGKLTKYEKLVLKGDTYLAQNREKEARKTYNKALILNPSLEKDVLKKFIDYYNKMAEKYYGNNDWEKAISYYDNFLSLSPESEKLIFDKLSECYENQWRYYRDKKDWNSAINFYETQLSKNLNDMHLKNADYHFRCGLAYFFSGYEHAEGDSFFTNIQNNYRRLDDYFREWSSPQIFYNNRKAGEYALKTKTLNGGKKNKSYITYEKAFDHFSKALEILPSWKSYFGMGMIHLFFIPLTFNSSGGLPYSISACGNHQKAEGFFLKSIEKYPNWQSYFCCINKIYPTKFVNTENFNSQDKKKFLDFLNTGINLSLSNNAPDYVLKKMYYWRGYFYEKFEKKYDLAIKDYENANNTYDVKRLEEKLFDEKIAKEKGYKSLEAYYAEKDRLAEIERKKEQTIKRQTFDNFYSQVLYEKGIPLEIGDSFTISANFLKVVDRVVEANGYTYLVTIVSSAAENSYDWARSYGAYGGGFRHCFYVTTKNPLNLDERTEFTTYERYVTNRYDLKLLCAGKAQYQRNYQDVDCYTFVGKE